MPVAANKTASDNQSFPNMPPFAVQKAIFYTTKGHLLHDKRPPFAVRKVAFWKAADCQQVTDETFNQPYIVDAYSIITVEPVVNLKSSTKKSLPGFFAFIMRTL